MILAGDINRARALRNRLVLESGLLGLEFAEAARTLQAEEQPGHV